MFTLQDYKGSMFDLARNYKTNNHKPINYEDIESVEYDKSGKITVLIINNDKEK